MVKSSESCHSLRTNGEKIWPYDEYYIGNRDDETRRKGHGENHWTGAESIEWYTGRFIRDTLHGDGEYRWRYRGPDAAFVTYEGCFYTNNLHGYGTLSYPDGRVFDGIFHNNFRWGPGVEHHTMLREDVGFWRGTQLIRLTWRPPVPNVAPDLASKPIGIFLVEPYRVILSRTTKIVGETNYAIELLKQQGAKPQMALENWSKLYPRFCTDLNSPLCHVDVFDHDYYKGKIHSLETVTRVPENEEHPGEGSQNSDDKSKDIKAYFAWNNNETIVHMMKHCYKHEKQRKRTEINLAKILNGPRNQFKPPGKHERNCRTVLMSSYLGVISNVASLINEHDVYPDIADVQGNSAVMYATCGDQIDIIHFLVEAGANVDSYNDSCCTPLGVALMRYACFQRDISANAMTLALLPQSSKPDHPQEQTVFEWKINRGLPMPESHTHSMSVSPVKSASTKRIKSLQNLRKPEPSVKPEIEQEHEHDPDEPLSEEIKLYNTIYHEFMNTLHNLFSMPTPGNPIPYIYAVNNMVEEGAKIGKDQNAKRDVSKPVKKNASPNKEVMFQGNKKDVRTSLNSFDQFKKDMLSKLMLTILQLLSDGANPKLIRYPQPALFTAVISGNGELVRYLVHYGADITESYPQALNYTALDVAVSRPFTFENLDIIQALLENGADTNHRLRHEESMDLTDIEEPGPTLFHVVLARYSELELNEEVRCRILELLLKHNCDPLVQYRGRSAIDTAMTTNMQYLDIFIKSPKVNLNRIINSSNNTILVKMFNQEYFKSQRGKDRNSILTNLLLYGADPLLECHEGENTYGNIFVLAMKVYNEMCPKPVSPLPTLNKKDSKAVVDKKPKKATAKPASLKAQSKLNEEDAADYREAINLVKECTRIIHIRWLQAKLTKDLIEVVNKYKHRPWIMIMKEHKNQKSTGLWLTATRCLEIWDIIKTTKKKLYNDDKILKHLLRIVHFYYRRSKFNRPITSIERGIIESDVFGIINEYKAASKLAREIQAWQGPYLKPELAVRADDKFNNVCFECGLPLNEDRIRCFSCNILSFCSMECIKADANRTACHPCSLQLKMKYFPTPPTSDQNIAERQPLP